MCESDEWDVRAKQMYDAGVPVKVIASECFLTIRAVQYKLRRMGVPARRLGTVIKPRPLKFYACKQCGVAFEADSIRRFCSRQCSNSYRV